MILLKRNNGGLWDDLFNHIANAMMKEESFFNHLELKSRVSLYVFQGKTKDFCVFEAHVMYYIM